MQISVAAVECDVPHVSHHDVLHTNVVLPEKRKRENNVFCIFLFCWGGEEGPWVGHKPWTAAAREWPLVHGTHTLPTEQD